MPQLHENSTITLNTEQEMPVIGLGTWKADKDKVGRAVEYALLECGYCHVDCAAIYQNEKKIGQAFKRVFSSGKRKRGDVFVTSKLWNSFHAADDVFSACKNTLRDLGLEYLDLYLVHWGIATPKSLFGEAMDENGVLITADVPLRETWEAMQELVAMGLVKSIGVSNFTAPMILDLLSYARIKPSVNQIELHPYNPQHRLVEFCQYKQIAVTAYSPLGRPHAAPARPGEDMEGMPVLVEDEKILHLAEKYHKAPSQILIRWALHRGTIVIPKSVTPEHIKNNRDVFDFDLSDDDVDALNVMGIHCRLVDPYQWWKIPYFG